jgi:hypothetical protein
MKPSKQIEPHNFKKRTIFVIASIFVALLTTGYLLFNKDYEDTPITNMTIGNDSVIQFGKNKVMVVDPDTPRSAVVLRSH